MRTVKLGELGIDHNSFAAGPFGSSVSSKHFVSEGIPMIRGSNLSEDVSTRLIDRDFVYLPERIAESFPRSVVTRGDLVFTTWGTLGQVGLIDAHASFDRYLVSNKQMKFTPDPERVDPLFIYYYMAQQPMLDYVRSQAIGSSVPGFNLGQLKEVPVLLPSLPTQQAIAEVLGALDDKIAANSNLISTARELAIAHWRLLKKGATRTVALEDIVELQPPSSPPNRKNAPYLDMKNLPENGFLVSDWSYRQPQGGARFINGDTLLARITPCFQNGKMGFVDFLDEGQTGVGSTEYIVMRSKEEIPAAVSYVVAADPTFRSFAAKLMTGTSGRQRVQASELGDFQMKLPEPDDLAEFGALSEALTRRAGSARTENIALARTRDELLPLLMNGRMKVRDAQARVEEVV